MKGKQRSMNPFLLSVIVGVGGLILGMLGQMNNWWLGTKTAKKTEAETAQVNIQSEKTKLEISSLQITDAQQLTNFAMTLAQQIRVELQATKEEAAKQQQGYQAKVTELEQQIAELREELVAQAERHRTEMLAKQNEIQQLLEEYNRLVKAQMRGTKKSPKRTVAS